MALDVGNCAKDQDGNSEQLAKDLWQAVDDGDINRVTTLIEMGADPNHSLYWSFEWRWKSPPLHLACERGKLPITRILVERSGANINRGDGLLDRSPLHLACEGGQKDLVKYLIEEAKCKVDVRDKLSMTPLHCACEGGHKDLVVYLIEVIKCDVDVSNEYNGTPLHCACRGGHKDVVVYLIEVIKCDVDVRNKHNKTPLHFACREGHKDLVVYLIEEIKCDVDVRDMNNNTPLHCACKGGNKDLVVYLIEVIKCDVDVRNKHNKTPFHCACGGRNKDLVLYLIEDIKCDVDVKDGHGRSPLDLVLENVNMFDGCNDVALYLINHGCGDDEDKNKLLCGSCQLGRLDVVKELVEEHNCDPKDVRDEDNKTPLHCACWGGHKDLVEYLIEVIKCDVDVKDEQGQSPLDLALEEMYDNDCIDVALYLINRGCGDDENKNKLLRRSCLCSRLDVVKELVEEHNCDPKDVKDGRGQSPLDLALKEMYDDYCIDVALYLINRGCGDDEDKNKLLCGSCQFGRLDVVKELVEEHNCDSKGVTDNFGNTPLDLATQGGDTAVIQYLKSLPKTTGPAPQHSPGPLSGRKRPLAGGTRSKSPAKKAKPQTEKPATHRICSNCNSSCHIRFKKCPTCENEFPSCTKSKAKGEPKKNPANLLQILQKKVDQLQQNGYDVVVLVHKPNEPGKSRHLYRKYCTPGCAEEYLESPLVYSSWKDHCSKNSTPIPATSQSTTTSETQRQATPSTRTRNRRSRNGPTTSGGAQSQTHDIELTSRVIPSRSHDMPRNDEHNSQDISIPHGVRNMSHPTHGTSHDMQGSSPDTGSSHDIQRTSQHIQGMSHNIQTPLRGSTSSQPTWSFPQSPSYHINSLPRTTNYPVSNTFPIPRAPFSMPHPTTYHPPYQQLLSPFHTPPGPVLTQSQQLPSQTYNFTNVGLNTHGQIWNPNGEQNSDQ